MPVAPNFTMDETIKGERHGAVQMLGDYKGGHANFPVAQGIVDEFVGKYKSEHKQAQYSIRNNVVDVNGKVYDSVVVLDKQIPKRIMNNTGAFAKYIAKNLIGKK